MTIPITMTAFYRFIVKLDENDRIDYFLKCAREGGESFFDLCKHFNEYNPLSLSKKIEEFERNKYEKRTH